MENLLPILIGIIWVAFTLYNKGKKKKIVKPAGVAEVLEKKPLSIFEQILMGEEIREQQPYSDYIEQNVTKPVAYKEEKLKQTKKPPSPFLNEELASFIHEGQSMNDVTKDKKTIEEILHEQEAEIALKDFDIRKAVIYSEILNTPYIDYK
jgi:hypothetical protein